MRSVTILFWFSGAIFEQGTDEVQTAFKLAVFKHNQNNTERRFELQAYVDVIKTADAFKLSKLSELYFSISFAANRSRVKIRHA